MINRTSSGLDSVWHLSDPFLNQNINVPDPYASRGDAARKCDVDTWDLCVATGLVIDALKRNKSVIVFCSSKAGCVNMCDSLTKTIDKLMRSSPNTLPGIFKLISSERANINGHLHVES
ncbi:Fructose-1,6-bisphosphatase class 1 3 [Frankliniella fusca]|uniref:Fructose-1,6-bisphosphatase class 1 3 n=1 Tax=Frankliniella fusca TaxID=407009 RepID=A0AAE1HCK1_9NEOP|nr:Fructose-1,6-bisphosphatase class 1 3 [Frankliniella fusca]